MSFAHVRRPLGLGSRLGSRLPGLGSRLGSRLPGMVVWFPAPCGPGGGREFELLGAEVGAGGGKPGPPFRLKSDP